MELKYEIMIIICTSVLAFLSGFKKAKSTCCCCTMDIERDTENKMQGVKVVRRQRSTVVPDKGGAFI